MVFREFLIRWRPALIAGFTVFLAAAVIVGGPPEVKLLKLEKPMGAADQRTEAFYYDGPTKVPLSDTNLAVVKLKAGVTPANLSFQPALLEEDSPLSEQARLLQREGLVIVSTTGPHALNLLSPADEHRAQIEWILPVVSPVIKGVPRGKLIMQPRITAEFAARMTDEDVKEYVKQFNLRFKEKQRTPHTYILVPAAANVTYTNVLEGANKLYEKGSAENKVVYAYPAFIVTKTRHGSPGDPNYPNQWHLKNDGRGGGKLGADVDAEGAWMITTGSKAVRIAIIDDSVDKEHEDLHPNLYAGHWWGSGGAESDDPSPKSAEEKHGTCCAGVAVATANTVGGRGIAPGCGLIAVNFWTADVAQVPDIFYYCDEKEASVISCSWSWQSPVVFTGVRRAIENLAVNGRNGKGTVILFAAGNDFGTVKDYQQFGTLPQVICVGASDWRDDWSMYSNIGPEVAVVAPSSAYGKVGALRIETTDNTDETNPKNPGASYSGYAPGKYTGTGNTGFGGTSSATPLAAGVCGLILSVNPKLTAVQVREILQNTADKVLGENTLAHYDSLGHDDRYGYGRVNARKAVEYAKSLLE